MSKMFCVLAMPAMTRCAELLRSISDYPRRLRRLRCGIVTAVLPWFVAALIAVPATAWAQVTVGAKFSIASGWAGVGAASDGNNFLVPLESDTTAARVAAQLVSPAGAKIGAAVSLGHDGQSCCASGAAFDGTNYLVAWEEDQGIKNSPEPFLVYGQFISASGATVGTAFPMTTAGIWFDGMNMLAYGGGKYLLTYTRLIVPANGDASTNRYVAGRVVSPEGTLGSEFRISTGHGNGSSVAFDGTNFFVTWKEDSLDYEVRGRFVSPTGALGSEVSVNSSTLMSDNPVPLSFDGTNYMVVWTDRDDAANEGDVLAQRVSPTGALVGGAITVNGDAGMQMATGIAFDGTNYVATWIDMKNDVNGNFACDTNEGTCWDVYGQYIGKDGILIGSKFAIDADADNQMGGVGCANGKCMALVSSGFVMGSGGPSQVGEVYGAFLTSQASATAINLVSGWNLLGYSGSATMDLSQFGVGNAITVWKWVSDKSAWAFYAPSFSATDLASYAAGKGYDVLTNVNPGEGFWVNAAQPFTVYLPR